jgi:hypothetical protein
MIKKKRNEYGGVEEDLSLGSILMFLLIGVGMVLGMVFLMFK